MNKPIKRSKLRLVAGKTYYTLARHCYWYLSKTDFADKLSDSVMPVELCAHKSTLLKKLRNAEMWMQHNKVINLKIAIKKINGLIIEPGQTFSYWRQIGKPTKRKGYTSGMILRDGKVDAGIGGGLCQLSNLIFWLALHTPLTVIERWRHGYDVFPDVKRNQPFGSGATCAYPNIDLQIRNNTTQKFQLKLELTDAHLVGKWLSDKKSELRYEVFEKEHLIKSEWWGGYTRNNKIYRKVVACRNNEIIGEEYITENQAIMMYEPLLTCDTKKCSNFT